MMLKSDILKRIDHTELRQNATVEDYRRLCEEARQYGTATVCVPPAWVRFCHLAYLNELKVCTVVGFPFGYCEAAIKAYEARLAIANGASEIDMVINVGRVLSGSQQNPSWATEVKQEIEKVRKLCPRGVILKVIVEACYLNEAQKIKLCHIVTEAGADYIKTSTGFAAGGATLGDIELFKAHLGPKVKIKAAGGISTIEDAKKFIEAGCDRIGSSKLVRLLSKVESDEV